MNARKIFSFFFLLGTPIYLLGDVLEEKPALTITEELSGAPEIADTPQEISDEGDAEPHILETSPPTLSTSPPPVNRSIDPEKKWYFELLPGYFRFSDSRMRQFFGSGGFTARGEAGCRFYNPFAVWIDGGYFWQSGKALGGNEELKIQIASLTLGLKLIFDINDTFAFFCGAGPRLFILLLNNDCAFVRGDDQEVAIGGGFDAGFRISPFRGYRPFFFDLLIDYSLRNINVDEDENCSYNFDVDISGITAAIGVGIRF